MCKILTQLRLTKEQIYAEFESLNSKKYQAGKQESQYDKED
jgi:hypothetical protein